MCPALSQTNKLCLLRDALQPLLQSLPRLMRLLLKPGMMWPVYAAAGKCSGRAKQAEAVEVFVLLVAVQIVVSWAVRLMHRRGALVVK